MSVTRTGSSPHTARSAPIRERAATPAAATPAAPPAAPQARSSTTEAAPTRTATADSAREAQATARADVRARQLEQRARGLGEGPTTGAETAEVRQARTLARRTESMPVTWDNIPPVLDRMTQVDTGRGAHAGGFDTTRCTAAAITGGTVMHGPHAADEAVDRLQQRVAELRERVPSEATAWQRTDRFAERASASAQLDEAERHLAALRGRPAEQWTQGDLWHVQQALASTMAADQVLSTGRPFSASSGLQEDTAARYRDIMWGTDAPGRPNYPRSEGRELDVIAMPGAEIGHAALGERPSLADRRDTTHRIVYDPWPEANGTARVSPSSADAGDHYTFDGGEPGGVAGHAAARGDIDTERVSRARADPDGALRELEAESTRTRR